MSALPERLPVEAPEDAAPTPAQAPEKAADYASDLPDANGQDEAAPVVPVERRKAPRFTLLIQTAKLVSGPSEFLCVVRDCSSEGVRVRHFGNLPKEKFCGFELSNGEGFSVELIWQDDQYAGLRFASEVDLERIVKLSSAGLPKRQLRLNTVLEGKLTVGIDTHLITIRNLSQQGAGIECPHQLAIEQLVKLESDDLPPVYAKVRWRNGKEYGLVFEETLSFERLAAIVAQAPDEQDS